MSAALLDITGLTVAYGPVVALREASLAVARGEAVALLGANGAGKTTLLRALIGQLPAREGEIRLDGRSIATLSPERRARLGLGYAPEGRRVFPAMSVRDNLDVACREGAAERARRRAEIERLFPQLAEHAARRAWQLSGGQQQMLAIGRALMTAPRLLLLDEPSLGLSPRLTEELFARLKAIREGGTAILLAEQNVVQALALCGRAYVLQTGRIVASGAAAALAQNPVIQRAFLGGEALGSQEFGN
ncbi:MAG TPA: ABC transporter ATP-binding protein [Stellaceae bacterium]|nr:ABC transporter ATP-binding protein [Stellaceae bacterium]